jgi:hypothetical protein
MFLCRNTNAGWTQLFFYNIKTVFKYSTKKKDLNPKMKMGTNSFGVHIVKSNCNNTNRNNTKWINSFLRFRQAYVVRIWITFSALVIDCRIPFAMFSRLLLFSVMLKIVLGGKVPLSSSQRVDIIFDIVLGGTLVSYKTFTWNNNKHIEYIPVAMV